MTYRQELQEQYENALFALLIDEMAEQDGKEYEQENEMLKDNLSFVILERKQSAVRLGRSSGLLRSVAFGKPAGQQ